MGAEAQAHFDVSELSVFVVLFLHYVFFPNKQLSNRAFGIAPPNLKETLSASAPVGGIFSRPFRNKAPFVQFLTQNTLIIIKKRQLKIVKQSLFKKFSFYIDAKRH